MIGDTTLTRAQWRARYALRDADRRDYNRMIGYHRERGSACTTDPRLLHLWRAFDGLPYSDAERVTAYETVCWYSHVRNSAERHNAGQRRVTSQRA